MAIQARQFIGGTQSKNRKSHITGKQNWINIAMSTFRLE
jgi:hypothetical protein